MSVRSSARRAGVGRSRMSVLSLARTERASTLCVGAFFVGGDCLCARGILLVRVFCLRAVDSARNVCSWLCQDRTLSVQQLQAGAYHLLMPWLCLLVSTRRLLPANSVPVSVCL